MRFLTIWAILFLIIYAFKKDKKHETKEVSNDLELQPDEWQEWLPETFEPTPERGFSIELLSCKNNPVAKKLEAFSLN